MGRVNNNLVPRACPLKMGGAHFLREKPWGEVELTIKVFPVTYSVTLTI